MKQNKEDKLIKYLRNLIFRSMTVIVLFLILAIISKSSTTYKDAIVSNIYERNISFAKIKNLYTKYLGGITPLDKVVEEELAVFNEELEYESESIYHDGVKLEVRDNYLVPILEEGMVTTDEPGVYIEGSHGIRTENEFICVKDELNEYGQFMRFEMLTWAAIDLDGIDKQWLNPDDLHQLNTYHQQVYEKLSPYMNEEEKEWLKEYTKAVGV